MVMSNFYVQNFSNGLERYVCHPSERYSLSDGRTYGTLNNLRLSSVDEFTCCDSLKISSFPYGGIQHFYCASCKAHIYRNRFYSREQWSDYINEKS